MQTDLRFRWFADLPPDLVAFGASTYSMRQSRLLQHKVADRSFAEVVELARKRGGRSNDHFRADGTLIEAQASMKRFRHKDDNEGAAASRDRTSGTKSAAATITTSRV